MVVWYMCFKCDDVFYNVLSMLYRLDLIYTICTMFHRDKINESLIK